ncbi:hypothetical protein OPT61_g2601 [Boeremia exigua]|uniref:Uncharacterized protein n=1 Tax=Boeremia exigua TaxID=749465 RepID=A0ACC2IKW1_9PLEO|nr:hypothetical protein OPT61_g2601 [Boeremia exigua]
MAEIKNPITLEGGLSRSRCCLGRCWSSTIKQSHGAAEDSIVSEENDGIDSEEDDRDDSEEDHMDGSDKGNEDDNEVLSDDNSKDYGEADSEKDNEEDNEGGYKLPFIYSRSAVLLELSRHKAIVPKDTALDQYQKILAVLYLAKMPSAIGAFVTAGVNDSCLPFKEAKVAVDGDSRPGLRNKKANICCAPFIYPNETKSFLQQQWSVIAHVSDKADGNSVPTYHID